MLFIELELAVCTVIDSGFFKNFLYQSGVKSTVSWVFEDLKKATTKIGVLGPNLLKF